MKKVVLGIMLMFLWINMLALAFYIQSVKAVGTIYINADGSISPPEAPISSPDNITYTLTGNVTNSIVVQRSNIVVDGAGYTVEGSARAKPWTNIAILDISPSKTVVGKGFTLYIYVSVQNQGWNTETFNITAYANATTITTLMNIALTGRNSSTITLIWNTTGFTKGKYTISAYAWPVPGETDTADNTFIGGVVVIVIPGDINCDMWVNAKDAVLLGKAFGSHQGQAEYNPNADINDDDWINAKDAVILGKNFGASC
jgi:hypothetical protein